MALDAQAIVAPAPAQDEPDVIEVIGIRSGSTQKIDRRTYRVQQTPHSAQKDGAQLLRELPAVTITSDGGVALLGSGDVHIYVNGRPYQGDASRYLRTLHGSDIERVEVITNPSAQYSAEGTGGIINLLLRHKPGEGVSGNASTEASSLGHGAADATIKLKRGKWTYEAEAQGGAGRTGNSPYERRRSVEAAIGSTPIVDDERGRQSSHDAFVAAYGKLTYDLDSRTNVSARIDGGGNRDNTITTADFAGLTSGFQSFTERQRKTHANSFMAAQLNVDHRGKKEGDTLTAEVDIFGHPMSHDTSSATFSNRGVLSTDRREGLFGVLAQVDWQHVIGREILSIGGTLRHREQNEQYRVIDDGPVGGNGINAIDQYRAVDDVIAVYATFQQPIGSWTMMPGLRVEAHSRTISSPGAPDIKLDHAQAFPTFHVEHRFGKTLDLTLSYSKRIDRPDVEKLRPYRQVEDVLTSVQGNPRLEDQSTDAFELNLHYRNKAVEAGLIVYDRETSKLWSRAYRVVDGVSVYSFVNAGHRRNLGAEFDFGMPIVKHVKLNASVNLFDERAPVDTGAGVTTLGSFRYTTNATLEWNRADRGEIPGDVAQLQWTYNSPSRQFQLRNLSSGWVSPSYTHNFSRAISLTGTMTYATNNRHRLLAPLVQDYYEQRSPIEFKLKLVKTLGGR